MLENRLELYRRIERLRKRPLITYVTSARLNATGTIAGDCVPEIMEQLNALPQNTEELDLLIVSNGGDPTAAWRIVSLIRERVKRFAVLVPQSAYSAATLIALGADELVMHPNGNLGPTDPQIRAPRRNGKDQPEMVGFGSEDLSAFLRFARDEVGLTDQDQMLSVFNHFCEEVGSVAVGVSARSAQLSISMGEKLLQLHMSGEGNRAKARSIAQALTSNYFHHGYAVSRREAAETIQLPVAPANAELERLMWEVWSDLSEEMKQREPFAPLALVRQEVACAPLFGPSQLVDIPANLPPQVQQQAFNAVLQQIAVTPIPPVPFTLINAVMESTRLTSWFESSGLIFASKGHDGVLKVQTTVDTSGWITKLLPNAGQASTGSSGPKPKSGRNQRKAARKSAKRAPK